jgi:hypothetical protein
MVSIHQIMDSNLLNVVLNTGLLLLVGLVIVLNVRFNLRSGLVTVLFIVALTWSFRFKTFLEYRFLMELLNNIKIKVVDSTPFKDEEKCQRHVLLQPRIQFW